MDPAPGAGRVQAVADVLVDLPGDPGRLQALRVGRPGVAGLGVADDRAAARAVVADAAGPHVVAVGVGGAEQRAVVGVADGEGVGQRVVERDVVAGQVRHASWWSWPGPTGRSVPPLNAAWRAVPAVVEVLEELQAQVVGVRVERQDVPGAVGLVPDRLAARQGRPGAGRRTRARRAACRSSGRRSGSPASGRRCARRPRGCRCGGRPGSPPRGRCWPTGRSRRRCRRPAAGICGGSRRSWNGVS